MEENKYKIDKHFKYQYTEDEKKAKASIKEVLPFLRYYKPHKARLALAVFFIIADIVLSLIGPIFSAKLLTAISSGYEASEIVKDALIVFGVLCISNVMYFISKSNWQYMNNSVALNLKNNVLNRVNMLQSSCFDKTSTSKFTMIINGDCSYLVDMPNVQLINFSRVVSNLGFFAYLFYINVYVGLFMVAYVIIYGVVEIYRLNLFPKQYKVRRKYNEKLSALIMENIRGIKDVRGFNSSDMLINEIAMRNRDVESLDYKFSNINKNFSGLMDLIVHLSNLLFVLLCVYLTIKGQIYTATFIVAYNFKSKCSQFIVNLMRIRKSTIQYSTYAQRINELYDTKLFPIEEFGYVHIYDFKGKIEFKNVEFEYETDKSVLKGVSFTIKPNSMVSFVGKSGGGKSTILSLINKLYTLEEGHGEILLDDKNINELDRESIRENICTISQSPYIFDITIEENLKIAKLDATEDELYDVLKKAELYDFVMEQKDKLQTKLGENGIRLSGGQKQRLAIARALLKNSKVLIFDEATSSLDNENQAKIKNIMKGLSSDHTIILIAHRLSTVVDSDQIYFLDDGKVIAKGTHKELIKTCKEYNNLYKSEEDI